MISAKSSRAKPSERRDLVAEDRELPSPVARNPEEWAQALEALGERKFRADQVFRWIHQKGVFEPPQMTNLSAALRERLGEAGMKAPLEIHEVKRSSDGTRKLLLQLDDGGLVECVLIPMTDDPLDADAAAVDLTADLPEEATPGGVEPGEADPDEVETAKQRVTLCISTQVGCAMGCRFCASGQAGLKRGLDAAEIVAQVLISRRYLDPGEKLRNLVFMGMGEPLHHYEQTARAIRLITHPSGLGMSPRRITVSTVGLVPGIRKLGQDFEGKLGLAVSLHAPDDATRNQIMPINQRFSMAELLQALRDYPLPKRRRITIEYTLIRGVNDSEQQAHQLADSLRGLSVKVNLIPMNPIAASTMQAPDPGAVDRFREVLAGRRVSCSVRKRRGDDVDAACGQLALQSAERLVSLGRTPTEGAS